MQKGASGMRTSVHSVAVILWGVTRQRLGSLGDGAGVKIAQSVPVVNRLFLWCSGQSPDTNGVVPNPQPPPKAISQHRACQLYNVLYG